MRTLSLIITLFTFQIFANAQLLEIMPSEFGDNPGNLKSFVYAPPQSPDGPKRPLVVAMHGCSQTANNLAETAGWNTMADQHNFVVLYPSQKITNNPNMCFNWFMLNDISRDAGEIMSVKNMIDYSIEKYNIDTSQIFVYGVSAGAALSVCMMAVYPEYFKAGAVFAGAPYKVATNVWQGGKAMMKIVDKTPEEWEYLVRNVSDVEEFPNLVVYHGVDDNVVDVHYSYELIEQWTALHDMDTIPDTTLNGFISEQVDRLSYLNDNGEEKVIFYRVQDLGHAIAVDPGYANGEGGKTGLYGRDIDFFSTYYVLKDFGLIKEE